MLITEVTIGGLIIPLRLFKETRGTEIEMIRKSKPLSKKILLLMKKRGMNTLILKSTVLGKPPLFLT
jgi:hypothetical protein